MMRVVIVVALAGCLSAPPSPSGKGHVWRELPGANQPGALHSASMVYDETRKTVVLYGGINVDGKPVNATWELEDGQWEPICETSLPEARFSPAFAYDPFGRRLILAGGSMNPDLSNPINNVLSCDSSSGIGWQPYAMLPIEVAGARLLYDPGRDTMVLLGGADKGSGDVDAKPYTSTNLADWAQLDIKAPTQFGGTSPTVTYDVKNQRLLALKNYTQQYGAPGQPTDEVWALGAAATLWSKVCEDCSGEPRNEAALVYVDKAADTFVIGGFNKDSGDEYAGAWILDNDELIKAFDEPPARDHLAAAYNRDEDVLVVYGGNGSGCRGDRKLCETTWVMTSE